MLSDPIQHIGFLRLTLAGAGVDLLSSGDGNLHPSIDLSLLGSCGLALDIGDDNGGDDSRQEHENSFDDRGDVKHGTSSLLKIAS